jgi:hypothetical protein
MDYNTKKYWLLVHHIYHRFQDSKRQNKYAKHTTISSDTLSYNNRLTRTQLPTFLKKLKDEGLIDYQQYELELTDDILNKGFYSKSKEFLSIHDGLEINEETLSRLQKEDSIKLKKIRKENSLKDYGDFYFIEIQKEESFYQKYEELEQLEHDSKRKQTTLNKKEVEINSIDIVDRTKLNKIISYNGFDTYQEGYAYFQSNLLKLNKQQVLILSTCLQLQSKGQAAITEKQISIALSKSLNYKVEDYVPSTIPKLLSPIRTTLKPLLKKKVLRKSTYLNGWKLDL